MFCWGWVFLGITTLILLFKHEVDHSMNVSARTACTVDAQHANACVMEEGKEPGVIETYTRLVKILTLKPMMLMVVFLLTSKIASAATDGMTDLEFINAGVGTDKLASMHLFLIPQHVRNPPFSLLEFPSYL